MKYIALAVFVGIVVYSMRKKKDDPAARVGRHIKYNYPDMRVKAEDVDPYNPWPYIQCDNGDRVYLFT